MCCAALGCNANSNLNRTIRSFFSVPYFAEEIAREN